MAEVLTISICRAIAFRAAVVALVLGVVQEAGARQVYQLGGGAGRPWTEAGTLTFADADRFPGSLRPLEAIAGENLSLSIAARGGRLRSTPDTYTLPEDWFDTNLLMLDGDSTTAFVHPPRINFFRGPGFYWSVPIYLDLGAPFPVELIRIITRPDHPENQIRQYDLYTNDGSDATQNVYGDPIWQLVRRETDNLSRVIELRQDRQPVQHVYLNPGRWGTGTPNTGLGETWEVAELEVYGQGFVPEAVYQTQPLDMGGPASLGLIRWAAQQDPGAAIMIQSRSGADDQPEIYWRRTGVGDEVTQLDFSGRPLTLDAYEKLSPSQRGGITPDLENWSVWQTYELAEGLVGTMMRSPSPRRYLQFRVHFVSSGTNGGQLDSLSFEYSQPPVAAAVVGEIWPGSVELGESVQFTLGVRAAMESAHAGFTGLRVRTPALVSGVEAVRLDGAPVDFAVLPPEAGETGFAVSFPRVALDQSLLEVDFRARVFAYGTPFDGSVFDLESQDVPLSVVAGDAVPSVPGDALKVRTSLGGRLLGPVSVSAPCFSPNGDNANDVVVLSFAVLRVAGSVPVTVAICDLAGRRLRTIDEPRASAGSMQISWDGRDDTGALVPPGSYLYRITVEADEDQETRGGCVAVAY